ncbi:MAG: bifunctional riboflavin kinase/FAD synthetase [Candidatus Omnitrophica bacterium]|nr:bifunctional riboflavin kinase/FAD synthetase [Candidatus Omnitrophota bacterium]
MKKIYAPYKIRKTVSAIGVFDGVHRGHQKILKKTVALSSKMGMRSLTISFHPHPREVINPDLKIPLLTSTAHKHNLIEKIGMDLLLDLKFTDSLARMNAEDFVRKILMEKLDIRALVVGKNFLFGSKARGDFKLLKAMSERYGFRLFGVEPLRINNAQVSSTTIRRAIERGELRTASLMLGRPVSVLGTVVRGRRVGRELGFPTANINPHHEAIPPSGVYAVNARVSGKTYGAILNIGTRPTFNIKKEPTIELYIFNFNRDIYGKDVEIMFKDKIRDEKKFSSAEALKKQIKKDILKASHPRNI